MMDSETRRFIREEIARQVRIILTGATDSNTSQREGIAQLFPGMPTIESRPVMHPYGMVSRAPDGTIQVCGRQGEHQGNWLVLGHRDANRPDIDQGEAALYNAEGQAIYLKNGEVRVGSLESQNPVVLGDELRAYLDAIIAWARTHTHIVTAPGADSFVPTQEAALQTIQDNNVGNDTIFSDFVFTQKEPSGGD